jgi:hypothetical protein
MKQLLDNDLLTIRQRLSTPEPGNLKAGRNHLLKQLRNITHRVSAETA